MIGLVSQPRNNSCAVGSWLLAKYIVVAKNLRKFMYVVYIYIYIFQENVSDTWPPEIPGSNLGCAGWALSPTERLFPWISSPQSCVKRVPNFKQ